MNIHELRFTDDELKNLALLSFLGNWVANAQSVPGEESHPDLFELNQKLLKQIKDLNIESSKAIASSDGELAVGDHVSQDGIAYGKYIEPYNDQTVFEELALALSGRDAEEEMSDVEVVDEGDWIDKVAEVEAPLYENYIREFANHGLARLVVDKGRK